jgi:predicted HTH domain antitoxin
MSTQNQKSKSQYLHAYERAEISLGQLAKSLGLTKRETMIYLSEHNIPVIDYDFQEDLRGIERLTMRRKRPRRTGKPL